MFLFFLITLWQNTGEHHSLQVEKGYEKGMAKYCD